MNRYMLLFVAAVFPCSAHGQISSRSLSLNSAVALGLKNNPELNVARSNVSVSDGRFWSGIALPSPELSAAYEYAPLGGPLAGFGERSIGISQSFEFPLNYFFRGSMLSTDADVARLALGQAERSVVNRIRSAYFKAVANSLRVLYAEENCSISEAFASKAEIRSEIGEASALERLTARVQHSESRNNLSFARNERASAYAELNHAIGLGTIEFDTTIVLTDSLVGRVRSLKLDSLLQRIEQTNPHVAIERLRRHTVSTARSLAWASLLPNFNIAYYRQTRDGSGGFYGVSLGVSIPLWFMFDSRGKIQEAEAELSAAESRLVLARNDIALRVRNAFAEFQNTEMSVRLYRNDLLPEAEEIYRAASRGYGTGDLSYLEYLQAKQTLINARNGYVSTLLNYIRSISTIDELVGRNADPSFQLED
jgi:outer membrane protein TolC